MRYLPNSDSDRAAMLEGTGRSSVEELFEQIPGELRLKGRLDLPGPALRTRNSGILLPGRQPEQLPMAAVALTLPCSTAP